MKKLLSSLGVALSLGISASATAGGMVNGVYQWDFLNSSGWPDGYNRNTGKPTENLIWARDEYSAEFFERINNALPERRLNDAFISDNDGNTIHLTEEAEVFVTFIHEGAGYRNAFGFFTFDKENPPTSREDLDITIIFPNLSYPHLTNGHRRSLGTFPAGTSIGFFIAANGYWWWTGVKDFHNPYYYSLNHLNPEQDESLRQHTVLLYDEEVSEVIMGFEDLPREWGDNDFNDAIFSVKSSPSTAISSEELNIMPQVNDRDADGVPDDQDEFPDHHDRAYSSYYPNNSDWVTLAYEDNWPKLGDYDMNDLIVRERFQTIYNGDGEISGFKLSGFIDARGASKRNGFALRLMNKSPSIIGSASITINGQTYDKQAEDYQTDAVIQLWRDSHALTQTGQSGKCSHFNTVVNCGKHDPVPYELDVEFTQPVESLPHSDLDFFIFRTNKRWYEIHFAGYPPTDLFNESLFGRHADTSIPEEGRYFKSADNLPWGLKINSSWNHPREYIDVLWAYPKYENWVESSGVLDPDWYLSTDRKTHKFNNQ